MPSPGHRTVRTSRPLARVLTCLLGIVTLAAGAESCSKKEDPGPYPVALIPPVIRYRSQLEGMRHWHHRYELLHFDTVDTAYTLPDTSFPVSYHDDTTVQVLGVLLPFTSRSDSTSDTILHFGGRPDISKGPLRVVSLDISLRTDTVRLEWSRTLGLTHSSTDRWTGYR